MRQCKLCLNTTDHPFGDPFDSHECRACSRIREFDYDLTNDLIKQIKENGNSRYHCLVLLKGTPEDFFVINTLLERGLYPLCVFVNSYLATDVAWQNVHTLIHTFDLELRTFNPEPTIYKRLIKYTFRRFSDILTPVKMLQYSYTVKLAAGLNIAYILSGENQVQMNIRKYTNQRLVMNTPWSVYEHDVHTSKNDFFGPSLDLCFSDVSSYDPLAIIKDNLQWVFLSDILQWNQFEQDKEMTKFGAQGQFQTTTFDYFHRSGSSVFYEIHDILRYNKFGSIKADDQLSREIRRGSISKADALILSEYYKFILLSEENVNSQVCQFFTWLGLDAEAADWFVKHRLQLRNKPNNPEFGEDTHKQFLRRLYDTEFTGVAHKKKDFCVFEKGV